MYATGVADVLYNRFCNFIHFISIQIIFSLKPNVNTYPVDNSSFYPIIAYLTGYTN